MGKRLTARGELKQGKMKEYRTHNIYMKTKRSDVAVKYYFDKVRFSSIFNIIFYRFSVFEKKDQHLGEISLSLLSLHLITF